MLVVDRAAAGPQAHHLETDLLAAPANQVFLAAAAAELAV
jgi:hypothetical protein